MLFFCFSFINLTYAQSYFEFSHPDYTGNQKIQLEKFEYVPRNWNGKVILMSHGSTGGKNSSIGISIKYLNIAKLANEQGYVYITFMRKGRGKSNGGFTEETGRCDQRSLMYEVTEAEVQLEHVIKQIKIDYKVDRIILMGHSRGGFLSSYYAMNHPDDVMAVVNLAGGWSTFCEQRNGGFAKDLFEKSANQFKPQYWAYFENDTYFSSAKFGDPDYLWFSNVAKKNQVYLKIFSDSGRPDGHQAPIWVPNEWASDFFPKLNSLK